MKYSELLKAFKYPAWIYISLIFSVLISLSMFGFSRCIGNNSCNWLSDSPQTWFDALFNTFQMLVLGYGGVHGSDAPWQIQVARFGIPILTSSSIILAAIRRASYQHMAMTVKFWNDHIVFCGCGDQGRALIKQYLDQEHPKNIVVIDVKENPNNDYLKERGVIFLNEDAQSISSLKKARVLRSSCIYIMTGSDQTNLEIFDALKEVISKTKKINSDIKPQNCIIHIYESTLKSSVDKHIEDYRRKIGLENKWKFQTFNVSASCARSLLTNHLAPHHFCPEDMQPHILVLGNGWLAEQLIIQGANIGHYSNGRKLRITCIDENAEQMRDALYSRFPAIDPVRFEHMAWNEIECRLLPVIDTCFITRSAECIPGNLYDKFVSTEKVSVVYVCHPDRDIALRILAALQANFISYLYCPELVFCDLHGNKPEYFSKINEQPSIFDAISEGVRLENDEAIIHGVRENWAVKIHKHYLTKNNGQNWHELSEDKRDSNRQSADHWKIKFDLIRENNLHDLLPAIEKNLDLLMRMEHDRWCAERFMKGWRYCNNPESKEQQMDAKSKKRSWCLCAYDDLPYEEQQKDKDVCDIAAELQGKSN